MNTISMLVVEDNPADAALVKEYLRDTVTVNYEVETIDTLSEALSVLSRRNVDIVLLDLSLPDSSGVETVRTLTGRCPQVAIIVLTGLEDENAATQSLRFGAQEYLEKRNLSASMLRRTISYALERKKALREKDNLLADLTLALERIELLQRLLPVCPSCRKIHAEDNRWYQADEYFKNRGGDLVEQDICPSCLLELQGGAHCP
jgi:DNA-binding response OmpR family regulator